MMSSRHPRTFVTDDTIAVCIPVRRRCGRPLAELVLDDEPRRVPPRGSEIGRDDLEERLEWGEGYTDAGYVFARQDGEPYHPDAIRDQFDRLCRRAKVPAIGLHAALRHLHGSVLLRRGVPLHVVSRRLGHANEAFTAKVYAHVLPGQGAEAAAAFAGAIDGRA